MAFPLRSFAAAWVAAQVALHGPASPAADEFRLKLDLDPLVKLPGLWETRPDDLAARFAGAGFNDNPYFQWTKGGKERAVFAHRPYRNITVDLSILAGKLPLDSVVLDFKAGKAARLVANLALPSGDLRVSPDILASRQALCEKTLDTLLGVPAAPQPRLIGSQAELAVRSIVWTGAQGAACLDTSPADGLLRFTLAPPGTDPASLAAEPIAELFQKQPEALFLNLDALLATPDIWNLTPDRMTRLLAVPAFEEPPFFRWLTSDRSGARLSRRPFGNVSVDLRIFSGQLTADEALLEFKDGRVSSVTVSLFNRGDSGELDRAGFEARYKTAGRALGEWLKVSPREHRPASPTAVKTTGWLWTTPDALALLECNSDALEGGGRPEFLRLKLSPAANREELLGVTAIGRDFATLKRSELLKFVRRETNGDVVVSGVPMVDQGDKGYCVVASCQRLFAYLRVPGDQHEIAALAGSDADRGTSSNAFSATLLRIANRFRVNVKELVSQDPGAVESAARQARFAELVRTHVDEGLPLLWLLELGRYKEDPPIALQDRGYHMRLIIGYNLANRQILFTDSWGEGHERKRMDINEALNATARVYRVEPRAR